ncbi:breast cancer anti-estrogen resistance protein 3 homolog [Diadema setosum]|uniref:breast cancer anti-estrogen resistance protein 3 homolog n=1 Tax=Diadema setosum TaxID=31175 RepID=UPI003B3A5E4E
MYREGTMTLGRVKGRRTHADYSSYVVQSKPPGSPRLYGSPTRMNFHLEISVWLQKLELEEYAHLFKSVTTVQDLLHWSEKDLLDIGIRNGAHRARLASNLVFIREKLKRTSITGAALPPLSSTPPRSPRSIVTSASQLPPSPSRLCRYSSIPEDQLSRTPPSPVRSKMSLQDLSPEDLRKQLEEEFKLPSHDIRSHAWFHGGISRDKAEKLICENGDFLVRDSISKPGNFVLTVRWKDAPMHFVINKVVHKAHSPYASVQYQFEKECFDTIPSLIKFYVGSGKPVSQASGAVSQRPINRTQPLSYTDSRYAATNKLPASYIYGTLQKKVVTPRRGSMNGSDPLRQRSGSNPASLHVVNGGGEKQSVNRADSQPLLGRTSPTHRPGPAHAMRDHVIHVRTGSEPILSPSRDYAPVESDYAETRPCLNTSASDEEGTMLGVSNDASPGTPSPGKVPGVVDGPEPSVPTEESSMTDSRVRDTPSSGTLAPSQTNTLMKPPIREHIYSEIDAPDDVEERPTPVRFTMLHDEDSKPIPAEIIQPPVSTDTVDGESLDVKPRKKVVSGTRFSVLDSDYSRVAQRASPNHLEKIPDTLQTILPVRETESVFQPQDFTSSLLEAENKPLDKTCMDTVRRMLLEMNPLALARHLTLVDTQVCRIGHGSNNDQMPGLELLCLPHGTRFRQDILERHNCLKMFCMATLLTCDDLEVRVHVLHQWLQLAETLRGSLGNLFSFATIMDALASKQIVYLRNTWDLLRSRFTNTAVNYDTKLRSLLKSLNAGENVVPLTKTSLPHILPIILLLERDWSSALDRDWSQTPTKEVLDSIPSGEPWEESAASYGLDILIGHLQNAHMLAQQTNLYRINAHSKLAKHPPEEGALDIFRAELHLRLLWGSRATTENATERYTLLEQVLSIMAQKLEFSQNSV